MQREFNYSDVHRANHIFDQPRNRLPRQPRLGAKELAAPVHPLQDLLVLFVRAVAAEYSPQLQRPKAPPEREPVVGEAVDGLARPQVLGHEAERAAEILRPASPEE